MHRIREAVGLKLCAAQMAIAWENKAENLKKCSVLAEQASSNGAQLIVFPELTLTGFSMNKDLSEPPDGDSVNQFMRLSEKIGIAAGFGFACRTEEGITNRFCIVNAGRVVANYDKIHPFSYGGECATYTGGNLPASVELFGEAIGLTVCYDMRFPELYQALSQTCTLIINIANWPDKRRDHWQTLLKARSIECQSFIAGCNRCGSGNGLNYSGDSAVYSPWGEEAAKAEPYKEQLIYAEINGKVCREAREIFPVKQDRKLELYRDFYAK